MFTPHDILWSILLPVAIVLGILLSSRMRPGAWATPLALGIAFLIVFPAIKYDAWRLPSRATWDATDWICVIALAATFLGIIDAILKLPNWIRAAKVFVLTGTSVGLLLQFKFRAGWNPMIGSLILGAAGVLGVLWWSAIEITCAHNRYTAMILAWLIGVCFAAMIMPQGDLTYGKFSLVLAAGAGATMVAMLLPGSKISLRGFAIIFAVLIVAFMAAAFYMIDFSPTILGVFASTPLFIWAGQLLPRRMKPRLASLLRLMIAAIPLATAVILAIIQFRQAANDNSYYQ